MLAVDLCEAEDLRVRQLAPQLFLDLVQVFDFLGRECQSLLLIVFLQILNLLDGSGLDVHREDFLVQSLVETLEHGVVFGLRAADGEVLLNTRDAAESHVLGNLNGIRAPRSNHLAARTHEVAFDGGGVDECCAAVEPAEFVGFFLTELMVCLGGDDALAGSTEKEDCHDGNVFLS